MSISHAAILAACILAVTGAQQPRFTDVTRDSGIHSLRYAEGVVMADHDGDGLPELYLPCVKGTDRLFHNLGGLKFEDVTKSSGITNTDGIGAVSGDLDGDGTTDIYIVRGAYPYGLNVLYAGKKDGGFADVTDIAGVASRKNGIFSVLGDYDLDGDLDMFVANWGVNTLYKNDSAPGCMSFKDVTDEAGLGGEGRSWSAVFSDFDGDSLPDLFVCQGGPGTKDTSRLYVNRGVKFEDVTGKAGLSGISSMGAVSADFDSDGDQDLFVASFDGQDRLFINDGKGNFTDRTAASGIDSSRSVGAAAGFVDGDFLPDLVVAGFAGPAKLYRNLGGGRFEDVTTGSGLGKKKKNEGAALGDLDGDGDLDLYTANYDGANALYRNNLDSPLFLKVLPTGKGRGLAGAKAMLYRPGKAGARDGLLASEEYQAGSGFCSQPPAGMLFRIPDDGPYDLVVRFPGGRQITMAGVMRGAVSIGLPDEKVSCSGPKDDGGKTSVGEVMK